jgi:hypothetical protein
LVAVGFNVLFAPHTNAPIEDDTKLLRWARQRRLILVRHDVTGDKRTRLELFPEIHKNGGKMLCVRGGPSQDPLISLGKILAHLDAWNAWFKDNDGVVTVSGENPRYSDRNQLLAKVQGILRMDIGGVPAKKPAARQRPKRRKPPPLEQHALM